MRTVEKWKREILVNRKMGSGEKKEKNGRKMNEIEVLSTREWTGGGEEEGKKYIFRVRSVFAQRFFPKLMRFFSRSLAFLSFLVTVFLFLFLLFFFLSQLFSFLFISFFIFILFSLSLNCIILIISYFF